MNSHISPGLAAEFQHALSVLRARGTEPETLRIVREIVARRLAEIDAEMAEFSDSAELSGPPPAGQGTES
jgi:hypothetical protein